MNKDVQGQNSSWIYSEKVRDHFFHPRNFMADNPQKGEFNAFGQVGNVQCGDIMAMWIKINSIEDKIIDLKWRTFGCASAIAATSVFSEMILCNGGSTIENAVRITPQDIMEALGGLPARKVHCSVLADKAFRQALNNYFRSRKEYNRIISDGSRMIDPDLNITENDIINAIRSGAKNLEEIQEQLKAGIGRPEVKAEIENLIIQYNKSGNNCPWK